jgi:hypothetical protein
VQPTSASNSGNTPLVLDGILFDQFKHDNGTDKHVPLQCRFKDAGGTVLADARPMTRLSPTQYRCVAPKSSVADERARIEITANGQHWQETGHSIHFYNGPKVVSVNPTYGVTKNPRNQSIEISGENLNCPNNDCSKVKVRFTNKEGDEIIVRGELTSAGTVKCAIPAYPAPETLNVDVSLNGLDYSNDKVTFGYIDPFVLGVEPRLISTKGTTKVALKGYGFVRMEDAKMQTALRSETQALTCSVGTGENAASAPCTKTYTVVNEKLSTVDTFPQAEVSKGPKNVGFEPINIDIMSPDGDYEHNEIDIWYYKDPVVKGISTEFAYINERKPILLATDFAWGDGNHPETFRKYSTVTCRFSGERSGHKVVTEAVMEASPIGSHVLSKLPDQIRCRTPKWPQPETAKLEISVNGQDYLGNYEVQMVEALANLRIYPLSGPIDGATKITVFGTGVNSSVPQDEAVIIKFGNIHSQPLLKSQLVDANYDDEAYHAAFSMHKQWLRRAEANWQQVDEGAAVKKYVAASSPDIRKYFLPSSGPDWRGMGGVVTVQLGELVPIRVTGQNEQDPDYRQPRVDKLEVVYPDSSQLEYYYYRSPTVVKVEPLSGLLSGGTAIDVTGTWFDEKPEYGLFPFCRIGGSVTRAKFI